MYIGLTIRSIRKEQKMTQIELAKKAGISQTSLCQIEGGHTVPHDTTLFAICACLGVSPSYVYVRSISFADVPEKHREIFPDVKNLMLKILSK
jgi:transcriptional regulator with XRE-family HTH domain